MGDIRPLKGPINQPFDDEDTTAPARGPTDEPIDDPDDDLDEPNADEILEKDRFQQDANESVIRTEPRLPQDFGTPATSAGNPFTRGLPPDHPVLDTGIDKDEAYDEDETDASGYWDQHESNDRRNDAFLGDNGPDL